ncbi:MAG TPA: MFS transporter [Albitalea sp.]|uniref:MFS transporter n=1 Tax=Piscinibacter sp. TaxID=1903157 RepID=UPI002ED53E8F
MASDSLFAQRPYMQFWFSRLSGAAGNQMMMVAVGWQMYDLTRSAWDLGLVGLLQFLPALLLTLPAGHVADRLHRGRILAVAMGASAVLALVLVVATRGQWATRELLLLLSVALGTVKAFQMPASQSLAPLLVPTALLPRALAFSSSAMQASVIVGPALGGFIYVAGADAVYAACAALFALAFGLMLHLRYEHAPPPREPVTLGTLFAGVHFIRQRPVILGAISLDLFAVLLGGATALLPMFAKDVLHTGPWGLGLLRAAPGAGALLMSAALTRWPVTRRVGRTMFAAVAAYGVATLVFGLSTQFVLSLVALFASGAADMVSVVIRQTMVQLETPNEMRGRVSAVNSIFIGASNQLGEFESGAVAAWLGPVGSVVFGGIGTLLVAALWTKLFPSLARRQTLSS